MPILKNKNQGGNRLLRKKDKYKTIRVILLSIILALLLILLFVDRPNKDKNTNINTQSQIVNPTSGYEQITLDRFKAERGKKKTFYLMVCSMPNDECIDMNNIAKDLSNQYQIYFIDAGHYTAKINAADPESYEAEKALADFRSMLDITGTSSIPSIMYYQDGKLVASYNGYFTDEYYKALENDEDTTKIVEGINDNIKSFIKQNKTAESA